MRTLDAIEDGTVRAVPQPADGVSLAPEAHPGRRPGGLEAPRPPDRPPGPRLHPRPRGLDRVRRAGPAAQAVAGHPGRRRRAGLRGRPRAGRRAWPRASCASTGTPSTSAPARSRSASATSSRRASAACPPPTGPAACTRPATATHPRGFALTERQLPPAPPCTGRTRRPRRSGTRRTGGAAARRRAAPRRLAGATRPGRSRAADPRRTAYDVLAAVRDRAAYANLLLPRLLAERAAHRPRRRPDDRARLRHPARPGHLRRGAGRVQRPAAGQARPAGPRRPPAGHPPAAQHPRRRPRRRRHLGRPGQVGGRPAGLRLRQRGPAPRRHPGPRGLAGHRRPRPGGRPGRLPRGPLQPPAVDRRRLPGRPGPGRGGRPRGLADASWPWPWRRATPARGSPWPRSRRARPARRSCRPDAEPGRWSPYAFTLAVGRPGPAASSPARPPSRTRAASWPRSPWPAPRSRRGPAQGGDARALARPVRGPRRQGPPAVRPGRRSSGPG